MKTTAPKKPKPKPAAIRPAKPRPGQRRPGASAPRAGATPAVPVPALNPAPLPGRFAKPVIRPARAGRDKTEDRKEQAKPAAVQKTPDTGATSSSGLPKFQNLEPPKPVPPPPPAQPLALEGPADRIAVQFLSASPSAMAATQAHLAPALNARLASEQRAEVTATPPLQAGAEGGAAPAIVAPVLPQGGGVPAVPGGDAPAPDKPAAQLTVPALATTNAAQSQAVDQAPKPSLWEAFKSWISGIVTQISTRDGGLSTRAGPAEKVALTGSSDPSRARQEAAATRSTADREQARQQAAFISHPGQARVQPQKITAKAPVTMAAEPHARLTPATDPAMAAFAKAPLPPEVRAHVDGVIAPSLGARLGPHRQHVAAARQQRDRDRQHALDSAQRTAQGAVARADGVQRARVLAERRKIATEQGKGMAEAQAQAAALKRDTDSRSGTVQGEVSGIVTREEGRARTELTKGEQKAETERKKGEAEARGLKAGLKAKTARKSWWGRLKSAVKSAVKAVTRAIDAVFTRVRKAVAGIIKAARDAAIGIINKARKAITKALNAFRDWAKRQVNTYLSKLAPGLAKRINSAIDGIANAAIKAVNTIADGAVKAVNAVASGLGKALDKVLQVFQTALTTGLNVAVALATGDFQGALREAIIGACKIAGVDPNPVFRLLDKAGKAIGAILKNPVGFARNLFSAVGQGVRNFFGNIGKHLVQGVMGWLTGALPDVGITGPFSFTPVGIGRIVLQVLGVTYANIRARVIRRYPPAEKVIGAVEKGMGLVKELITKGPMALWGRITKAVGDLKSMVLGAVGKFLSLAVLKEGVIWLLSMLNPASALVKIVKAIFDLVMTVIARFQQLKSFVQTIWGAVASILAQKFKAVTKRVEDVLARGLPVVISLLAGVLGLGGLASRVSGVLKKVTAPVNKVIDRVTDRVIAFARKLVAKGKAGAKKVRKAARAVISALKVKLTAFWTFRKGFRSKDGGAHRMFYRGTGKGAKLKVKSKEQAVVDFLHEKSLPEGKDKALATEALRVYREVLEQEIVIVDANAQRTRIQDDYAAKAKQLSTSLKDAALKTALDREREARKLDVRKQDNRAKAAETKRRDKLVVLAMKLEGTTFGDNRLIQSEVKSLSQGDKGAIALPLTYFSGKVKGSAPKDSSPPDGWKHATEINDATGSTVYIRGHLVNDNLHGPGLDWNLVPITQSTNRRMSQQIEEEAKGRMRQQKDVLYYKAWATVWKGSPIQGMGRQIFVEYGTLKEDAAKPVARWEQKKIKSTSDLKDDEPDKTVSRLGVRVGVAGRVLLRRAIGPDKVSDGFVRQFLVAEQAENGKFTDRTEMRARLIARKKRTDGNRNTGQKEKLLKYIAVTTTAALVKKLKF